MCVRACVRIISNFQFQSFIDTPSDLITSVSVHTRPFIRLSARTPVRVFPVYVSGDKLNKFLHIQKHIYIYECSKTLKALQYTVCMFLDTFLIFAFYYMYVLRLT